MRENIKSKLRYCFFSCLASIFVTFILLLFCSVLNCEMWKSSALFSSAVIIWIGAWAMMLKARYF